MKISKLTFTRGWHLGFKSHARLSQIFGEYEEHNHADIFFIKICHNRNPQMLVICWLHWWSSIGWREKVAYFCICLVDSGFALSLLLTWNIWKFWVSVSNIVSPLCNEVEYWEYCRILGCWICLNQQSAGVEYLPYACYTVCLCCDKTKEIQTQSWWVFSL